MSLEIQSQAPPPFELSESVKQQIEYWLEKYPPEQRRSAVVPALLLAQAQNNGWLSENVMDAVAHYLGLDRIQVYEVATFYDMYELSPIGRHKISICTNVSCMLRGSEALIDALRQRLGVDIGETTPDGMFTLREVECMGACGGAPMCQVNDQTYYETLTPETMLELIDALAKGDRS